MTEVDYSEAGSFTIDEHCARTRHFDLRLMHRGSVILWAVAPAIPVLGDQAHSAIRIEELPLTAREGVAMRANRTPWDDGRMTVRSWRDGQSAVVTLHGSEGGGLGGTRTVSLVHVGNAWEDDDHWTIVALDDAS